MDIIIIIILKLVNYEFVNKDLIMNIKNIGKFFEDCMKWFRNYEKNWKRKNLNKFNIDDCVKKTKNDIEDKVNIIKEKIENIIEMS